MCVLVKLHLILHTWWGFSKGEKLKDSPQIRNRAMMNNLSIEKGDDP